MEGTDRRVMNKTWSLVAATEERIQLMKRLIKLDLGVAEVEELGINIHSKFKSKNFKNRVEAGEMLSKEALKGVMLLKLRDEKKHLEELQKTQKDMRRKIEDQLKKNSRPARGILKEFREASAATRRECRKKYDEKIEHLKRKYRERNKDEKLPEDMEDLSELRVFNEDRYDEIEKEKYDIKIIGDVELNEKELQILKLHPKFAILPKLVEGGLDIEEELANSN